MQPFESPLPPPSGPPVDLVATFVRPAAAAQPRRRRFVLLGGLSLLTAAALIAGGALLFDRPVDDTLRDDATELATDADRDTAGFSYAAAAADARESASMALQMSITSNGGRMEVTTRIDRASGVVAMDMDASAMAQDETETLMPDSVEVIIDDANGFAYFSANVLGELADEVDVGWLTVRSDELADNSSGFDQMFTNPLSVTDVLGDLDPVDLGLVDLDGETLRHFSVTVDEQTLAEASGTTSNVFGGELLGDVAVTYDVWVSEDDRVRRISFEVTDPDSVDRAAVVIDIETSAESIVIEVPDPRDVIDFYQLFSHMGEEFED